MNKADLLNYITTYVVTTGNRSVTAAQLRTILTEFVNSYPNLIDDADILNVGEHDPAKTYPIGSVVVKDGNFLICTSEQTGAYNAAKWLNFPLRPCVISVSKWTGAVASIGDVTRHNYRLYVSENNFNVEEPGTGSAWTEIEVWQPGGQNAYVTDQYYQDLDVVLYVGSLYVRNGSGYSSDFASELVNGEWVLRYAVDGRHKMNFNYSQMSSISSRVAEYIGSSLLPPGAMIRSVKTKLNTPFSGGGNTTAVLTVHHSTVSANNLMLSDDVFTGAPSQSFANSFISAPSNSSYSDVIVRVEVDSAWSEVAAGEIEILIDYSQGVI